MAEHIFKLKSNRVYPYPVNHPAVSWLQENSAHLLDYRWFNCAVYIQDTKVNYVEVHILNDGLAILFKLTFANEIIHDTCEFGTS